MSAASSLLTEDQFLCSICLNVFTDPFTIPCGHNFCKTCITELWDIDLPYQCPNCREVFNTKPELKVNTFISEMAAQFRQSTQQDASSCSSEEQLPGPKEVPRDVYSGSKRRTWMFLLCLLCVFTAWMVSDQKKHLVGPLKEEYEAKKAELWKTGAEILHMIQKRRLKIQEIKHSVELSDEDADREISEGVQIFTALKGSVERSQAELIETIKEKQRMTKQPAEGIITELEQEISELQKRSTEVEQLLQSEDHQHLLQSFTFLNTVPPTKDWTEVNVRPPSYEGIVRRAVTQLEETLSEQMKKLLSESDLKRVQQYEVDVTLDPDTAHPDLIVPDDRKQDKHVTKPQVNTLMAEMAAQSTESAQLIPEDVPSDSYSGTKMTVFCLEFLMCVLMLWMVSHQMKLKRVQQKKLKAKFKLIMKRVQQSAVDVTLDPDTAHPDLILSDDGKQVKHGDVRKNLPDNPKRFDTCGNVLAKQSFSSGRFYYEVQVKGKTAWTLGVVRESISRKGNIKLTPQKGHWTIVLRNDKEYKAAAGPGVLLSLKSRPQKVGVFLDYEEGRVSFYDVDAEALIYSFTGFSFTQKLYPFFSPSPNYGGKNSAPLIISPVSHTE